MAYPGHQCGAGRCSLCVSAAQGYHLSLLSLWQLEWGSFWDPYECLVGREAGLYCLQEERQSFVRVILVGWVSAIPGSAKLSFGPPQTSLQPLPPVEKWDPRKSIRDFMSRENIGKAVGWNSNVPWKESPHFLLTAGIDISFLRWVVLFIKSIFCLGIKPTLYS